MGPDANRAALRQSKCAQEQMMAWSEAARHYKTLEDVIGGTPLVRLQRLPSTGRMC